MRSDPECKLVMLVQSNDKCPVEEWIRGIRDKVTRLKIERQIDKLARGLGLQKSLGSISELKIDLGPDYRIYYALLDQKTLVVLLSGGDKSDQGRDIAQAKQLWQDFEDSGHSEAALRSWREAPETEPQEPLPEGETK